MGWNMKYRIILFSLIGVIWISGCRTPEISATAPGESYIPVRLETKPSHLLLTVNLNVSDIEKLVNLELNGLLYEDNSLDNNNRDNLMLKVWKRDNFKISLRGNELSYRVPLKIWAKAGFRFEKFGISLSDFREFNAEIALNLRTRFSLNTDWTFTTKTIADGYEWIKEPTITIAGRDMPVGFVADAVLSFGLGSISSEIDEAVGKGMNLQDFLGESWQNLQKPMLVSEEYNLWVLIKPLGISTPPISTYNNKLQQKIYVEGIAETSVGKEPSYTIRTALPPIKFENPDRSQFEINLMNQIPFSEADSLAARFLAGQTFSSGKKSITITGVRIYGSRGQLITETTVSGSIQGKLYFTGTPYFNKPDSTIRLRNFEFDVETRNILVKSANWLLNSKFRNVLEEIMVYPLGSDLLLLKTELENGLNGTELGMGFTAAANLKDIMPGDVFISPDAIQFPVIFKGSLNIVSESLRSGIK